VVVTTRTALVMLLAAVVSPDVIHGESALLGAANLSDLGVVAREAGETVIPEGV